MKKLFLLMALILPTVVFGQQYTGLTGLIQVPTAEMAEEGQARLGSHFINREMMPNRFNIKGVKYHAPNLYLGITPFSWLELAYTMTFYKNYNKGYLETGDKNETSYHFKDRYFSVKVQVLKEKGWRPSVAVGTNDPFTTCDGGNQHFGNYFIAASKHFTIKNHILATHLSYRKWVRHRNNRWNGFVGGITYQPAQLQDLRLITEYTGDAVNVGFDWKLWKHVQLQASLYEGKYFCGGVCLYMNLL